MNSMSLRGVTEGSDEAISSTMGGLLRREERPPRNDISLVMTCSNKVASIFAISAESMEADSIASGWIFKLLINADCAR